MLTLVPLPCAPSYPPPSSRSYPFAGISGVLCPAGGDGGADAGRGRIRGGGGGGVRCRGGWALGVRAAPVIRGALRSLPPHFVLQFPLLGRSLANAIEQTRTGAMSLQQPRQPSLTDCCRSSRLRPPPPPPPVPNKSLQSPRFPLSSTVSISAQRCCFPLVPLAGSRSRFRPRRVRGRHPADIRGYTPVVRRRRPGDAGQPLGWSRGGGGRWRCCQGGRL